MYAFAGVAINPFAYPFFGLDCDMDLEWLTDMRMSSLGGSPKSRPEFTEVFGRINPWVRDGSAYSAPKAETVHVRSALTMTRVYAFGI